MRLRNPTTLLLIGMALAASLIGILNVQAGLDFLPDRATSFGMAMFLFGVTATCLWRAYQQRLKAQSDSLHLHGCYFPGCAG